MEMSKVSTKTMSFKNYALIFLTVFQTASALISRTSNVRLATTAAPRRLNAFSERTTRIFDEMEEQQRPQATGAGGAGGSPSLKGLENLDKAWGKLKDGGWKDKPFEIVFDHGMTTSKLDGTEDGEYDAVVSGGTLGVFYAAALQKIGYKTAVVERGKVAGREQEWNISRKELKALIRLEILTEADIEAIISIEFNPVRVGFKTDTSPDTKTPGFEVYVNDILNLGVKPDRLIEVMKKKYESLGGVVLEGVGLSRVDVYSDMAHLTLTSKKTLRTRLMLDAMGNGSPITKQIRGPVEPDGVCIVVGSCASGFNEANNTYSDVIYTDTPITSKADSSLQYFWEAFPAGSGKQDRTTYLFTYMDAKKERPNIAEILDDYWELMPRYQGKEIKDLKFLRILYGMFPTYRDSPLQTPYPRVLAVGDASGVQSPLSFGGFGSLTRHIERIITSLDEALQGDLITAEHLSLINPYQPNLSACWMFQRAMSVKIGQTPKPGLVVGTLSNSFSAMEKLGPETMNPFLQDVLQFGPLLR
jgi:flavin-dependent dehydrogenase